MNDVQTKDNRYKMAVIGKTTELPNHCTFIALLRFSNSKTHIEVRLSEQLVANAIDPLAKEESPPIHDCQDTLLLTPIFDFR